MVSQKREHAFVCYRQFSVLALLQENWDDAAAATDDIAVAYAAKAGAGSGGICVALDKEFLCRQLGGPVEVNRVNGFIGA